MKFKKKKEANFKGLYNLECVSRYSGIQMSVFGSLQESSPEYL